MVGVGFVVESEAPRRRSILSAKTGPAL